MHAFLLLLALCVQQLVAVERVVDLGYAKYRGLISDNDVTRWAGIRYARSPSRLNGLWFTAPQDPLPEKSIMSATEFGPLCIGANKLMLYEFGGKWSEDCLFEDCMSANVFAPTDATTKSKLPVYIFIKAGRCNNNGNANFNGTDLVRASGDLTVVVIFNYCVGRYGFLASEEIVANKSLSLKNGVKDQRQLSKFGGDPGHVTLGGAGAGAGSVVLQLTAYGGRDDKLFHAATIESPATPALRNVTESQFQYNTLLEQTGCKDLRCLTTMDAVTFQNPVHNLNIPSPGAKNPPIYPFNPTIDYDFIQDYTYNEF
ncbi:secreted lipase-like protein 1 [Paraphaeosphaeria sporulosa]